MDRYCGSISLWDDIVCLFLNSFICPYGTVVTSKYKSNLQQKKIKIRILKIDFL